MPPPAGAGPGTGQGLCPPPPRGSGRCEAGAGSQQPAGAAGPLAVLGWTSSETHWAGVETPREAGVCFPGCHAPGLRRAWLGNLGGLKPWVHS